MMPFLKLSGGVASDRTDTPGRTGSVVWAALRFLLCCFLLGAGLGLLIGGCSLVTRFFH